MPLAHLEEATQGGFPVRHVGAPAAAPGLLQRRLASPRQRSFFIYLCDAVADVTRRPPR